MPSLAVSISQLIARLVNRLHIGISELHHQRRVRKVPRRGWCNDAHPARMTHRLDLFDLGVLAATVSQ
jgi:hypothetical protein